MKLLIGIGLALAGIVGLILTSSIGFPMSVIIAIALWKPIAFYEYIAYLFKSIGYVSDVFGNVILAPVLNRLLISSDSKYKFGCYKYTISHVIAFNIYYSKSLTIYGSMVYDMLEWFEKGHCLSALMDFESKQVYIKPNQI